MATTIRPVGYTNSVQTLTVYPFAPLTKLTASLWGAGGGGGGADSAAGGSGSGGGFAQVEFGCNYGDVLTLAVGGGGGAGSGLTGSAPGGSGGAGNIGYTVFNSRQLVGVGATVAVSLPYSWSNFMNSYAVWNSYNAYTFDVSTTISAPITGVYVVQTAFDDQGVVYIDGVPVAEDYDTYPSSATRNITITAGSHTLRIVAYNSGGGPAGAAVSIQSGGSYSGAPGGASGPRPYSGAGGGGGGATILIWNNSLQAVAGGGGGGGGGGNGVSGGSAPGPNGQTTSGFNGEYGSDHPGDGGGGGGGGGGCDGGTGGGGNGGAYGGWPGVADVGGQAGTYGASWSASNTIAANANGQIPYQYTGYQAGVGVGGSPGVSGSNGYAIIYMDVPGIFVNQNGVYYGTKEVYVNVNGVWRRTNAVYINRNGTWTPVAGQQTTNFASISGGFGMVGRPSPYTYSPVPESPTRGGNDWFREHYTSSEGTLFGGQSEGCTCYLAGSKIAMADGRFINIEDVKVGDQVLGAFGEINEILALMHVKLGNRKMYKINQEHDTTYEEIHISADKKMHSINTDATYNEYGVYWNCLLGDGSNEMLMNVGVSKDRLYTLTEGTELQTITGPRVVDSIEAYELPADTTLYNFVLDGSHTFFVNDYAVASWPREDNFDYDQWTSKDVTITIENYKKKI